jgi:DNA repair protein RadA/Sms
MHWPGARCRYVEHVLDRRRGEVGLAGEVRPAPRGQERLKEAAKLGFTLAIIPKANMPKTKIPGLKVIPVERIDQAIAAAAELS